VYSFERYHLLEENMKSFNFSYHPSTEILESAVLKNIQSLEPLIIAIRDRNRSIGFIDVLYDAVLLESLYDLASQKSRYDPALIIVIGIGGSSLGADACYQAFKSDDSPKLLFVDTIDPDFVALMMVHAKKTLERLQTILIIIITKSGETLETMINAQLFVALLKQYHPVDYNQYVVVISEERSSVWCWAQCHNIDRLSIPVNVGGRYSIFTAAGLFPLLCAKIDIKQLLKGAHYMANESLKSVTESNIAATMAALLFVQYKQGVMIHDTFIFSVSLVALGNWYRQLLAESIGKKHNTRGQVVRIGLLPTVSLGTTDLHSVGQLYLAGPSNRFTTFISYERYSQDPVVSSDDDFQLNDQQRSCASLYHAILQGVERVYAIDNRPFAAITFPDRSEIYVGQFMQYAMMQVFYLAELLEVDPFDQPEVERYKTETKKILNGK